jgi:hypothetical protein
MYSIHPARLVGRDLMGYFAKIDNGIVTQVISINNETLGEPTVSFPDTEGAGRAFIANTLKLEGEWRQTSFNGNFRKRYSGIGFAFDVERDEFVPPDWELVDGEWTAPVQPQVEAAIKP